MNIVFLSKARDMIDDIQKEVEYQIKESTWMDGDTKHFILDKLVAMKNWVGYPDWYHNTTLLKRYFQGVISLLITIRFLYPAA